MRCADDYIEQKYLPENKLVQGISIQILGNRHACHDFDLKIIRQNIKKSVYNILVTKRRNILQRINLCTQKTIVKLFNFISEWQHQSDRSLTSSASGALCSSAASIKSSSKAMPLP